MGRPRKRFEDLTIPEMEKRLGIVYPPTRVWIERIPTKKELLWKKIEGIIQDIRLRLWWTKESLCGRYPDSDDWEY